MTHCNYWQACLLGPAKGMISLAFRKPKDPLGLNNTRAWKTVHKRKLAEIKKRKIEICTLNMQI